PFKVPVPHKSCPVTRTRNLKESATFPSMLGFKRRRAPVRHPPDVRAPEGDPPLRRPGERSGERGADPPGALARRVESRRPTIAHAARVVDPRGRTRSPPSHAAAGRARPAPVPGPLQFQPAKARIDDGPCRGRGEGDPRGAAGEPDVELLGRLLEDWEFDRVEEILRALAFEGQADAAYRPLLVAASAEPGFLGHTLSEAHAARLASRYLTPSENAWLLWKLYRTLTTKFGYPEFLRIGPPESTDRSSLIAALESSLRYKSPPAEETVRHALEADVPLDDILAAVVDFYGQWTVGEKEHTISYLNAVLQTAKFLGKEEALLPLAIGLSKLPF